MTTFQRMRSAADVLRLRVSQQRAIALHYHCRLAVETVHPRFGWRHAGHSVRLTVNSGYE